MRTYGLIGYPLGHSFSRRFFTQKFLDENLPEQYLNFEIEKIELLPEIIRQHPELAGLNVTIPYKQSVIRLLDTTDRLASETGAVNTVRIIRVNEEIRTEGYNTDVTGFRESILPLIGEHHNKALILGTGGAAGAVRYVFDQLGIRWLMVSRKSGGPQIITYDQLTRDIMEEHPVIVNTTPLGTFPHTGSCPEIPYSFLTSGHLLYDLVYNPPETKFMERGRQMGAVVKNGYEMLERQALAAYAIWNSTGR